MCVGILVRVDRNANWRGLLIVFLSALPVLDCTPPVSSSRGTLPCLRSEEFDSCLKWERPLLHLKEVHCTQLGRAPPPPEYLPMEWPANSPDLNPIEHFWVVLARAIYKHNRQLENKDGLKEALTMAWNNISIDELRSLIESIPSRCVAVVKEKGGDTKY